MQIEPTASQEQQEIHSHEVVAVHNLVVEQVK